MTMANDGQIVFQVEIDGKQAKVNLQELTREIQKESSKWDAAGKQSSDNIGNSFTSMLKKVAAGFSAVKIGKALLDLGKDAVQAASALEEVQNVVDVTFGANSNKIETWAKNAGTQFGLTETQAKKFTSTMGAMLKSSGLAGDEIVDVSTDLAGLAADMASFYNLDFDEAFSKIRSGISGMTMPLKELGIDMSVDTLNAFALAQGLDKTFSQMDQGEQTMLRYQYLMQATADAQGDFARTSDGYANKVRKLETNIESLKTTLGATFIDVVSDAVGALNGFLEQLMPEESSRTVLDDFADIDLKTETKLGQIAQIRKEADDLIGVLDEIYGTDENGQTAADIIGKYGVKSEEARSYLEKLGYSTDEINAKQEDWLETCKRLVKTIPGLSSIINTETGEVKGGKTAVEEYVTAWENGQKKIALLRQQEERRQAVYAKYGEIPGLEVDAMLARKQAKDARDTLEKAYKELNIDIEPKKLEFTEAYNLGINPVDDRVKLNKLLEAWQDADDAAAKAEASLKEQNDALQESLKIIEEGDKVIEETYGDLGELASESEVFWEKNAEKATNAVNTAKEALANLEDYVKGVHDAVEKSVDSTVKGFGKIETPMQAAGKKTQDLTQKLTDLGQRTKKNADEWDKLNEEINKYNTEKISSQGIAKNIQEQAQYMDNYLKFLNEARSRGISNDVLAELSDGSVESYDYLEALAGASDDEVKKINEGYQSVIDKKKELTDELTKQQLTVDKTYQSLADKAKEAVAELDLQEEAKTNSGKTIQGVAEGIGEHVSDVKEQVDAIIAELNRLDGYGIDIDFGGFGNISFTTSTGKKADASGRMGLDFVPRDDYLIRAHEGERLLTAQENQVWNTLLHGGYNGFDLDALGGVMRDNVKAGGNVYLDGKVVGAVVSDRQGRNYRSLQRSGWQS